MLRTHKEAKIVTVSDNWFTVEQIDNTTYAISEYGHWEKVHSYLLLGEKTAALIDTGIGIGNIKKVVDQITSLPVKVVTTHVHWDHIGGHSYFDDIYVHEREEDWLVSGIPGLPLEQIRHDVGRDITIPLPEGFDLEQYEPFRGKPAGLLKDGDRWDLGKRLISFIHTPGHSPGHLCVYEEERGYLYTADLIYKGTLYAFYPTTDPLQFVKSVEKISKIEYITKILPGHHQLELDKRFLLDVNRACQELLYQGLARHGTGIHDYEHFKIYF